MSPQGKTQHNGYHNFTLLEVLQAFPLSNSTILLPKKDLRAQ